MTGEHNDVVAVIEDDSTARESLIALVESMGYRCHAMASAEAFLEQGLPLEPSCLVLDLQLPGMSGIDLLERLRALGERAPIIVITGFATIPLAVQMMRCGVFHLLEKPFRQLELKESLVKAVNGYRATRAEWRHQRQLRQRYEALNDAERLVVRGMALGTPNSQLAQELNMGLRTLEKRRQQVLKKLQVDHLPGLIGLLYQIDRQFVLSLRDDDRQEEQTSAGLCC